MHKQSIYILYWFSYIYLEYHLLTTVIFFWPVGLLLDDHCGKNSPLFDLKNWWHILKPTFHYHRSSGSPQWIHHSYYQHCIFGLKVTVIVRLIIWAFVDILLSLHKFIQNIIISLTCSGMIFITLLISFFLYSNPYRCKFVLEENHVFDNTDHPSRIKTFGYIPVESIDNITHPEEYIAVLEDVLLFLNTDSLYNFF